MNPLPDLQCYRCGSQCTIGITETNPTFPSEMTVQYECTACGQSYAVTVLPMISSICAVSHDGKALALFQQCKNCGRLYQVPDDQPHVCVDHPPHSFPGEALVRFHVLGQFRLEYRNEQQQWQPVTAASLQHQRVRALLNCLVSSPGRKLGREQAIDMLWPELDFEIATNRLDEAIYSLRRLLEPERSRPATSNLLLTEHQTLQLADQAQLWIDADAFESLLSQARANKDPGQTEQLLEEAVLLYSGDFLPEDRDIPWTQPRREALQHNWVSLLLELADLRIAREALPAAIDTLNRLLMVDPANEAAVQRLITLLVRSGRRAEAKRIYRHFAAVLRQEFKIVPLAETRALLRRSS